MDGFRHATGTRVAPRTMLRRECPLTKVSLLLAYY